MQGYIDQILQKMTSASTWQSTITTIGTVTPVVLINSPLLGRHTLILYNYTGANNLWIGSSAATIGLNAFPLGNNAAANMTQNTYSVTASVVWYGIGSTVQAPLACIEFA